MNSEDIVKKLTNINNQKDLLDFFKQNNIDLNDERFKIFLSNFKKSNKLDENFLENISGGNLKSISSVNALKLTGCLFLAVGGGFAAGSFYGKNKNRKESICCLGLVVTGKMLYIIITSIQVTIGIQKICRSLTEQL